VILDLPAGKSAVEHTDMIKATIGIKMTHDAAVAAVHEDRILFSVEMEKVDEGDRYTKMKNLASIEKILNDFDIEPKQIVIDGWKRGKINSPLLLNVAPYHEFDYPNPPNALHRHLFTNHNFIINNKGISYSSYCHITGHIVGTFVTSPFPVDERCASISWDGSQEPRFHWINPLKEEKISFVASLLPFYGKIYSIIGYYFGPYKNKKICDSPVNVGFSKDDVFGSLDVPGKLMSYIGLGKVNHHLQSAMRATFENVFPYEQDLNYYPYGIIEHEFCRRIKKIADDVQIADEEVLATFHQFLEESFVESAIKHIPKGSNLCFSGGSALNIKWNTALRESGHFSDVWISPFPNDCGSAIGAAACEVAASKGIWKLKWDVYSGPRLKNEIPDGSWNIKKCTPSQLGKFISINKDEPVVVLHGQAELGPRALGHRSIFMHPGLAENKTRLNGFKKRESFRPVAPICLEKYAKQIFTPGNPDPFMLFDHLVKEDWQSIIPAVVHIDGTARLQTINNTQCKTTTEILTSFFEETGIPLLCNTSANRNGKGFFPGVKSACAWAEENNVKFVWSEGMIYEKRS